MTEKAELYLVYIFYLLFAVVAYIVVTEASALLIPVTLGVFLGMLFSPLQRKLGIVIPHHGISSVISFVLVLVIFSLFVRGYTAIVPSTDLQIAQVVAELQTSISDVATTIQNKTGLPLEASLDAQAIEERIRESLRHAPQSVASSLTFWALAFIVSILYLIYKPQVILALGNNDPDRKKKFASMFLLAEKTVSSYMVGVVFVILILVVLYSLALYVFGVPYSWLVGTISGLMTIVPTVGTFAGGLFAVVFTWISTGNFFAGLMILISYIVIQLVEGYYLTPRIAGSKVQLNTGISLISLIIGGYLWGVAGIFLAIPIVGTIKAILLKYDKKHWFLKLV